MAEALEVLTADTPLVLVLEDLHWSDYATLDLLALLSGGANQRDSWCWARIGPWMLWSVGILCKVSSKSCTSTGSARRSLSVDLTEVARYLAMRFPRTASRMS